jgi:hypothetical protein
MVTMSSSATIEQVKCIELRGLIKVRRGNAGRYGEDDGRCDDDVSPTLLSNEGFTWRTGLVLTYT